FLPVVVLAARTDRWTDVVAAHALCSVVSQLPLHVLARQPRVLARLAVLHSAAQLDGLRRAVATLRADLSGAVGPRVVDEALEALEAERLRLLDVERGAVLVEQALGGASVVPVL
ncbi:hypothetical protein, partial [Pseudokineococcus marinus]